MKTILADTSLFFSFISSVLFISRATFPISTFYQSLTNVDESSMQFFHDGFKCSFRLEPVASIFNFTTKNEKKTLQENETTNRAVGWNLRLHT